MAKDMSHDDAMNLWLAALAGVAELGFELERLRLSSRADCLEDAKRLRPLILENRKSFGLGKDGAWRLWMASLCGTPDLALELELLGLSSEEESLDDARSLRPMILDAMGGVLEE
jgi:hypothetical protein